MPICPECGMMFFGRGIKIESRKFCGPVCAEKGKAIVAGDAIPKEDVDGIADAFFNGQCPICNREGVGVDIRQDHRLISAIVVQHRSDRRYLCCRKCGTKRQFETLGQTLALGWWSPRGLFMTPVWLVWNVCEIAKTAKNKPSKELRGELSRMAGSELLASMAAEGSPYPRTPGQY